MKESVPKKNGENPKSSRGFGSMTPENRRRIASLGGKAAHAKGLAHQFTSEEARIAGRKGGEIIARNRQHMSEIGARGGKISAEKRWRSFQKR
jgi:general stress protein YciG